MFLNDKRVNVTTLAVGRFPGVGMAWCGQVESKGTGKGKKRGREEKPAEESGPAENGTDVAVEKVSRSIGGTTTRYVHNFKKCCIFMF